MGKRDIIIFVSPASAGKDYILNKCVEKFGWHKVVSHTTRIPRIGEKSGKDYWFINPAEFFELERDGKFIETTSYKTTTGTWHYGFHKDSVDGDGVKVMIANPHGVNQIIDNGYADRIMLVHVVCDTETRIKRYFNRLGESPTEHQLAEGFLRLLRDIEDFDNFKGEFKYTNEFYCSQTDDYKYRGVPLIEVYNLDYTDMEGVLETIKIFTEVSNEA